MVSRIKRRVKKHENIERVEKMQCLVCPRWPATAHHVSTAGAAGGYEYVDNAMSNLMPLCQEHHRMLHDYGYTKMIDKFPRVKDWLVRHDRIDILDRKKKLR